MSYFRFLKDRIRDYPWVKTPLFRLSVLNFLLSVTAISFAYVSKLAFDIILQDSPNQIFFGIAMLALIILAQMVIKMIYQYYNQVVQAYGIKRLQSLYFSHLVTATINESKKELSGSWMNYLESDIPKFVYGLYDVIPRIIFITSRFVFAFILLAYLDVLMAVLITGVGLVLLILNLLFKNLLKAKHHNRQYAETSLKGYLQEQIMHIPIIKAFQAEQYTMDHIEIHQNKLVDAKISQQKILVLTSITIQGLFMLAYAGVILFGAYRIGIGIITVGSLVAIIQLIDYMQSPFRIASSLLSTIATMEVSHERLQHIDQLKKEQYEACHISSLDSLNGTNISFSYNENNPIITDLSFTIKRGEIIKINGPSGIGKTTLLYLLLGLYSPSSGTVSIKTNEGEQLITPSTRCYFSYVPQTINIISGTIKENILYNTKGVTDEMMNDVCKLASIHDDIMDLELQYDTMIHENGHGFSEGQLQRFAIARALLRNKPVLLLDEVTSALDQKTEATILSNIQANKDKIIVLISHRTLPEDLDHKTIDLE